MSFGRKTDGEGLALDGFEPVVLTLPGTPVPKPKVWRGCLCPGPKGQPHHYWTVRSLGEQD